MEPPVATQAPRLVAGRYRLLAALGRGGTGTVWQAEDTVLGRRVAVKEVLLPLYAPVPEQQTLRERTLREARAASRLHHPGVVTIFDVVEDEGRPFIVMELLAARTLAEVVREDGPMQPVTAAQVGLAVLDAVEAAHAAGVVHRDIKPSNIMLGQPGASPGPGRVVLTDFGIAQAQGDPSLTGTGLLVGSPGYVAPERANGKPAGPPADLWGIGATLFFLVEGRPPYDGHDALGTLMAVARDDRAPLLLAGPLDTVLGGLLEPDPERRWTGAQARAGLTRVANRRLRGALAPAPRPEPDPEPDPEPAPVAVAAEPVPRTAPYAVPPAVAAAERPLPPAAGRRRRHGLPLLVAALVALLLGVGGVVALLAPGGKRTAAPTPSTPPSPGAAAASPTARAATPSVSASASARAAVPSPSAPPSAPSSPVSAGAAGAPAGWRTVTDAVGWTAAVPPTWTDTVVGPGQRRFRDPASGISLYVDYAAQAAPDATAAWVRQERAFRATHPDYARIRLGPVDYRGLDAADWEFTYGGTRALDRGFSSDGHGQALFLQAPAGSWAQARATFDQVAAAFRPAPR